MIKKAFLILILIALPRVAGTKSIYLNGAYYYDTDADGFVDSIVITYSGPLRDGDRNVLLQLINLPAWRNFTTHSLSFVQTGVIALRVTENRQTPVTSIVSSDYITIEERELSDERVIRRNGLRPRDRVAPVLVSARWISYNREIDSLIVTFSEEVNAFTHEQPFFFRVPGGALYRVVLGEGNLEGSTFSAEIFQEQSGEMHAGDSVWINTDADITDLEGNVQKNEMNRRVLLKYDLYQNIIRFNNAFYYDRDADGMVDSIEILMDGVVTESSLADLLSRTTLPAERNFTIERARADTGKLIFLVHEGGPEPRTSVFNFDRIQLRGGVIPGNGYVEAGDIQIQDRVAPVLLRAHLERHETGADTVILTLSETVHRIGSGVPFLFRRPGGNAYEVLLSRVSQHESRYVGHVVSVSETMVEGDLVWIDTAYRINDMVGNVQNNPENRRVPLTISVLDIPVNITSAAYFDRDADGFIDKIKIRYNGPVIEEDIEGFVSLIRLPTIRSFTIDSIRNIAGVLMIYVQEHGSEPRTSSLPGDRIRVEQGRLTGGGILLAQHLQVLDSMAPVLVSAHLDRYGVGRDSLHLRFSEQITEFSAYQPFLFRKPSGDEYEVLLYTSGNLHGAGYTAGVRFVGNNAGMEANDSVWINVRANINDYLQNTQWNDANRRVLLTIKHHLSFRIVAENNPFLEGKRPLPQVVVDAYRAQGMTPPSDGLVIMVEPDPAFAMVIVLQGEVSIYDVVQNPVIRRKSMVFERERNRLYFVWDGCNWQGRKTGIGTYAAVVRVRDQSGGIVEKRINLGIKRR